MVMMMISAVDKYFFMMYDARLKRIIVKLQIPRTVSPVPGTGFNYIISVILNSIGISRSKS